MIMRLKLKGNNKPLLIVCYECNWQDSLFRFQAMRLVYPFQWMTGIDRRRTLIITWKIKMKLINLKNHNKNMNLKFIL